MRVMLTTRDTPSRTANSAEVSRILDEAISKGARITITVPGQGVTHAARGIIADATASILIVQIDDVDPGFPVGHTMLDCTATFTLDEREFEFESQLFALPPRPQLRTASLARPQTLRTQERRKSPRQFIRAATTIELSGTETLSDWTATALLLNISECGLACRIDLPSARRLRLNQQVRVGLALGERGERFCLPARVAGLTQGASADTATLGLEFDLDALTSQDRSRLQQAIAPTHPAGAIA